MILTTLINNTPHRLNRLAVEAQLFRIFHEINFYNLVAKYVYDMVHIMGCWYHRKKIMSLRKQTPSQNINFLSLEYILIEVDTTTFST